MKLKFIILLLIFIQSCFPTKQTEKTSRNLSYIYNPNATYIHPDYFVYHKNDTASLLMIRFDVNELLFNQANVDSAFISRLAIKYELYDIGDSSKNILYDSSTVSYSFERLAGQQSIIRKIPFKATQGRSYMLRFFVYDLMRNYYVQYFINVDKSNYDNAQNFYIFSKSKSAYIFNYTIDSKDSIRLFNRAGKNHQNYFISYYKLQERYNTSDAGFVTTPINKPDSNWKISLSDTSWLTLNLKGSYIFRTDSLSQSGLLIHCFHKFYPHIKTAEDMIGPLAYLINIGDYRQMMNQENVKNEIDKFWMNTGRSIDKGRELIKIYYNRVNYANYYFTSDREGWKTDRGMIYILYGPPVKLYKSDFEEKWIYMENNIELPYTFHKRNNAYSNNDYILILSKQSESFIDEQINDWIEAKVLL